MTDGKSSATSTSLPEVVPPANPDAAVDDETFNDAILAAAVSTSPLRSASKRLASETEEPVGEGQSEHSAAGSAVNDTNCGEEDHTAATTGNLLSYSECFNSC